MTDLAYALRIELDRLVGMMPYWERYTQRCHDWLYSISGDNMGEALVAYIEAYQQWKHMRERMEWITELLDKHE